MFGTYVREDFLTPAECVEVRKLFPAPFPGTVEGDSRVQRRSRVSFMPPSRSVLLTDEQRALYKKITDAVGRANELIGKFDIVGLEPMQLAEYRAADQGSYDWHLDIGAGESSKRKLSVSIQLSDNDDYIGGNLEIWGSSNGSRKLGALVAFPSYLPHRVAPVTLGVRFSLVVWAVGNRSYL